ncbi:MAG TPA: peptide transporter [Clostridia bacterium]|nr:peptide transporter [Clostridia bacterium]
MRGLIRLGDYSKDEIFEIFKLTDDLRMGKYADGLKGKTIVLFFPQSSLRTRIAFEKGIHMLGGQSILFPPETLDKKERVSDVAGYLDNWVDLAVIRHKNIAVLDEIRAYASFPIINAMTDVNHPCEMLSDLYALSKRRSNFLEDQYLFCGLCGNIGLAWKEAAEVLHLNLTQSCPPGYEIPKVVFESNLRTAIQGKDIICTDSLPATAINDIKQYQINLEIMSLANEGAVLNPCPPFYRGEEVSEDVINSRYFVGYGFKGHLMEVQQAILLYVLTGR